MEIRRANMSDIGDVMVVIKDAQESLANQGIDQWQDGFPNEGVIKGDIENWDSFVLVEKDVIVGFFTISFEKDEGYKVIYDGQWLVEERPYATIHRTAISSSMRGKGLSKEMFDFYEKFAKENKVESIRIDTHEENVIMRHIIQKHYYTYCGHVFLAQSGNKRVVYEKLI